MQRKEILNFNTLNKFFQESYSEKEAIPLGLISTEVLNYPDEELSKLQALSTSILGFIYDELYNPNTKKDIIFANRVQDHKNGYELSWNIQNVTESIANVKAVNANNTNSISSKEQAAALTKLNSTVTYPEIFFSTNLQYIITPENLKENIILKKKVENPQSRKFWT